MESILLCYNRLRAIQIEIIIFISSIIGIILTTLGILYIPFEIDSITYKKILIINIPISFLIIIFIILFIISRLKYLINDKYNSFFCFLSLGLVLLCLTELISNLINSSLIITNIYYKYYYDKNKITKIQWIYTLIIIILIIINFFSLVLLSLSENLRINLGINGSYQNYKLAIKLENEIQKSKNNDNESDYTQDISLNNLKKSSMINIKKFFNSNKKKKITIKVNNNIINKNFIKFTNEK